MVSDQTKIAVAGILLNNNKVLLNKRKGGFGEGTWDLPAGHLKFGESPEDCVVREVKEETGIDVTVEELVAISTNKVYGNHYVVFAFLVSSNSNPKPELKEPECHECWEWFDFDNLPENLFIATRDSIEAYKNQRIYNFKK